MLKKFNKTCRDSIFLLRWLTYFFAANTCLFWLIATRYLWIILSADTLFLSTYGEVFTQNGYVTTGVFLNPLGKVLVLLFTALTFIGHFALLAFLPCLLLVPLVVFWPGRKGEGQGAGKILPNLQKYCIFTLAIAFATISVFWLLADSIVFDQYHFHLNFTWMKMLSSEVALEVLQLSSKEWALIALLLLTIIAIEVISAFIVWRYIVVKQRFFYGKRIAVVVLVSLLFSYVTYILTANAGIYAFVQQTPNLPFYNDILSWILPVKDSQRTIRRLSETRFSAPQLATGKLHYPLQGLHCNNNSPNPLPRVLERGEIKKEQRSPYNILIIGIDSWRFDAMDPQLTPNIYAFTQQSWQFNDHYSGGNSTQPGIFSLFYALPSSYWTATLQQQQSPMLIQQLKKQGYQTRVLWSANLEFPAFAAATFREIDQLRTHSAPGLTVGDRDRHITGELLQFLGSRLVSPHPHPQEGEGIKPFFVFIFYDAAHGYCWEQDFPQPFQPAIKQCNRLALNNNTDPLPYINRYKNAVHFVDAEVGKILQALQQRGLWDNTIVILTSDHGQEFNDNHLNYWGHASNFTPVQTHVPLFIHWPGLTSQHIAYRTSHYDIVPTLLQQVLGCSNASSDYSIGYNLFAGTPRPYLIMGSYIYSGILEKDRITNLYTNGDIDITDLQGRDLPNAQPRLPILRAVLHDMRRFFW